MEKKEDAFTRLFAASGCRTQLELAKFLDIRLSSVCDAVRRNSVPSEWLLKLLRKKWINPDWILTGLGPKKLYPANGGSTEMDIFIIKVRPPMESPPPDLVREVVRRVFSEDGE